MRSETSYLLFPYSLTFSCLSCPLGCGPTFPSLLPLSVSSSSRGRRRTDPLSSLVHTCRVLRRSGTSPIHPGEGQVNCRTSGTSPFLVRDLCLPTSKLRVDTVINRPRDLPLKVLKSKEKIFCPYFISRQCIPVCVPNLSLGVDGSTHVLSWSIDSKIEDRVVGSTPTLPLHPDPSLPRISS